MLPITTNKTRYNLLILLSTLVISACGGGGGGGGNEGNGGGGGGGNEGNGGGGGGGNEGNGGGGSDGGCVPGPLPTNFKSSDPLTSFQWHIKNTGQTAFAKQAGTSGADLNMQQTIYDGYTGACIKVMVADTGLEIRHEDLAANVESGKSCNFPSKYTSKCESTDPTRLSSKGDHGTSVAGLIAAVAGNAKGGRGVAPNAKLRGFNLLADDDARFVGYFLDALGGSSLSNDVDIFNQSYGSSPKSVSFVNKYIDANYWNGVNNLRNGKGAIYIKSAGNGFKTMDKSKNPRCESANKAGVSCENANMDPGNAQVYQIVVGAINADDKISSYSTHGSNVWISAYGGEYGINVRYNIGAHNYKPAMITTDQSTCAKGYTTKTIGGTSTEKLTPFHNPRSKDGAKYNANCNYTSTFNGTSSAAPILSGAVALMLEANSALTWRDVKHILAATATPIDTNKAAITYTTGSGVYTAADAWITNNAGYKFHNAYGFGKVNIDAAIAKAKNNYTNLATFVKGDFYENTRLALAIPDNAAIGVSNINNVADDLIIEAVQIEVNITHTHTGDLGVELTSPSGTKSILFNIKSGFYNSHNLKNMQLLSNAFYGENSAGNWTIEVVDAEVNDTGTLNSWKIRIYGH